MDGRSRRKKILAKRFCFICGEPIERKTKSGEKRISPKQYLKARFCSKNCKGVYTSKKLIGKNNYNWKGGISSKNEVARGSNKYKKWRLSVFKRDGFACQICGVIGGNLNAHHIKPFKDYPKDRFDLDNGITLCEDCHYIIHNK